MAQALTFGATILAAVLAYVFGVRQDRRSKLHGERIAATSAFCEAVMDYRGAQIHRWHAERDDAQDLDDARAALRDTRSAVWACYFRVVLVVDHAPASRACRATLDAARLLKYAPDPETLDADGDKVRQLAERFVGEVALKLGIEPASLDVPAPEPSSLEALADPDASGRVVEALDAVDAGDSGVDLETVRRDLARRRAPGG